jgi:hypothetical protein
MKYFELETLAVRKVTAISKALEAGSFGGPRPSLDPERRTMLLGFAEKGELAGPFLDALEKALKEAAATMKRAGQLNLPGTEIQKAREVAFQKAVTIVEQAKLTRLNQIFEKITKRQREHEASRNSDNYGVTNRDLLQLRRLELQHAMTDESGALSRLAAMQRDGYNQDELLVLQAKGERAAARVAELSAELPPFLADKIGIGLLKEAEELTSLNVGEISYSFVKAPNVSERVHVGALLDTSVRQPSADLLLEVTS